MLVSAQILAMQIATTKDFASQNCEQSDQKFLNTIDISEGLTTAFGFRKLSPVFSEKCGIHAVPHKRPISEKRYIWTEVSRPHTKVQVRITDHKLYIQSLQSHFCLRLGTGISL